MPGEVKPKIVRRQFDTYLAVMENSAGSFMFKNLWADVDGKKEDVVKDGWLSCAFYVSAILHMFGYVKAVHGTVESTVKDLKESGWTEVKKPIRGSVIVWKPGKTTNGHSHIGFYVGREQAISNDSWKKCPVKADWEFNGKRKVKIILWRPEITKL